MQTLLTSAAARLPRLAAHTVFTVTFLSAAVAPHLAHACACGCGIFDVGANSLMPVDTESGVSVWLRYSYMNQDQNWQDGRAGSAAANDDKDLMTSFYTAGGQWMLNRDWTVMAELPVYARRFTTTDDDGSVTGKPGEIFTGSLIAPGDLETTATYTGFSPDLSTGLTFGLKLPTGDDTGPRGPKGGLEFDRDSLPGTGSTDVIIGGYHVGGLNAANTLDYFVQVKYQFATLIHDSYRPGNEFDSAVGLTYDVGSYGVVSKFAPTLQLINSYRLHDTGANADPPNSGYERLLLAPGIDMRFNRVRVYGDIEVPIVQYVNAAPIYEPGEPSGQLAAKVLFKLQVSYDF